jgi:hypothetical protein
MHARYKFRDDGTLCYMGDAFVRFHSFIDVLLLGQAGNEAMDKAYLLRTELAKKRKVNEETNVETSMASKKGREMNACRDYIIHTIEVSQELDADFNFPNIHFMAHLLKQICRYTALQKYSAERPKHANKMKLKDGWHSSNFKLNYLP